jgi:two-component system, NarL family, nitrate/nitrite response regulator NarL
VTPIAAALSATLGDELRARLLGIGERGAVAVNSVPALERLLPQTATPIVLVGGPWPGIREFVTAAAQRRVPTLVLTDFAHGDGSHAALRDGARAILPADANARVLRIALDAVDVGLTVLSGETRPAPPVASDNASDRRRPRALTQREREILALVAAGASNKTIARRLGVSPNTVKFHIVAVFNKLEATTRAEAVAKAARLGELSL